LGAADLGVFAAAAYVMTALGAMIDAIVRAIAPRLATLMASRNTGAFADLLRQTLLLATLGGLAVAVLMAIGLGEAIMRTVYGHDYSIARPLLTGLAIATVGVLVSAVLGSVLLVARAIWAKTAVAIGAVAVQIPASILLVPRYGIMGAVYSYGISIAVRVAAESLFCFRAGGGAQRAASSMSAPITS
jgi:O-antigen/teichoic acid export membrane protein